MIAGRPLSYHQRNWGDAASQCQLPNSLTRSTRRHGPDKHETISVDNKIDELVVLPGIFGGLSGNIEILKKLWKSPEEFPN